MGTEQVDQLWTDITEALEQQEDEYFLGAIVLANTDDNYLETIDGQQRLATLTILLSVLRDQFYERGNTKVLDKIHDLVIRTDFRGNQAAIRTLGADDAEDLHKYVQLLPNDPDRIPRGTKKAPAGPGRPPKNYIRNAYDLLWNRVDEYTAGLSAEKAVESLIRVAEFVTKNLTFITAQVESDEHAYVVFETLNDRGLDLSIADLLKNHLFSLAARRGELTQVTALWGNLVTTLENIPLPRFFC